MKTTYKTLSTKATNSQYKSTKVSLSNKEMAPKFYQSVVSVIKYPSKFSKFCIDSLSLVSLSVRVK
jgi:hypothetical protein